MSSYTTTQNQRYHSAHTTTAKTKPSNCTKHTHIRTMPVTQQYHLHQNIHRAQVITNALIKLNQKHKNN